MRLRLKRTLGGLLPPVRRLMAAHDRLHEEVVRLRALHGRSSSVDDVELAIRYFLPPGSIAIDVGANVGRYTRVMAEIAARVYAFEPQHDVFRELQKSVAGRNVTCFEQVVSDRSGPVDFYLDTRPDTRGVASSVNVLADLEAVQQIRRVSATAVTLDELVEREAIAPALVKIDVEGHEPAVFRGAARTIERHRPVFLFEFWETWWEKGYRELFETLEPFYWLTRVHDGADALALYRRQSGTGGADILARPKPCRDATAPAAE